MYNILHGWPAEGNITEELKIYHSKQDEFTVEDGCFLSGTRVVIPMKYQAAVLLELHLDHPGMVRMRKSLATGTVHARVVAKSGSRCGSNGRRLLRLPS